MLRSGKERIRPGTKNGKHLLNLSAILPLVRRGGFLFRLFTWTVTAIAASFSILLLSLRYWLLPDIEQYRENIASAISHASGQLVTLGEISANWDGFRPHMMLRDVKAHDKEGDITLLLHRLEGTLSWRSILHGELLFREIAIDQPDLTVRRDSAGVIHVAGFALKKEPTDSEHGFSDWLLNQRRVTIKNANILWQDDQRSAPELELRVNLRLENRGRRHRFGVRAIPRAELGAQLDMRGDFTGETLDNPGLWRGRLFMQVNHADIAAWHAWLPFPEQIKLHRGFGALRMWAGIDGADINKLTADMRLYNVKTQLAPELPELNLIRLGGRVGWQKISGTEGGGELFTRKLSASVPGKRELPPLDFSLQRVPVNHGKPASNKLNIDNLKLEILGDLAKYLPIGDGLRDEISAVSPRGELHSIRAKWSGEWPRPSSFNARGRFTRLGMRKSGSLPAFSGVTGNFDITERSGTLNLNSQNAILQLPYVFSESLRLGTLTGQASWNFIDKDSIAFKFNNISFSNAHAAGLAYGNYRSTRDGPGVIDLVAHLTHADADFLKHHTPVQADRFIPDWLKESIVAGVALDGRLRLKGDLAQFPFAHGNQGIFRLHSKVSGVTLDNLPGGWPRFENVAGNLLFNGNRMELEALQADVLGARLSKARLDLANMGGPNVILKSEVEASGPTLQFLKFAASRTADDHDDKLADNTGIAGDGRLLLKLDIPLYRTEPIKFSGNYQFIDNKIKPGSGVPDLNHVNGALNFTDSGITIENITAQFLGGPIVINSIDAPAGSMRLSAVGKVNLDNLYEPQGVAGDVPQGVPGGSPMRTAHRWIRYVRGSTDWRAVVNIRKKLVDVSIESSLRGITSDLPEPFSKAGAAVIPLFFERKATGQDRDELSLAYGNLIAAKIKRVQDDSGNYHANLGSINFGTAPASPSGPTADNRGVSVNGTLPLLNVDRWRRLLKQFNNETDPSLGVTDISFHIGTLDFLGRRFNDVQLEADKKDGLWYSTVAGEEINGGITWDPSGNGKIVAKLNRLIIPASSLPKPDAGAQQQQYERNLPALDVTADNFIFGEKQLGKLELIADQEERNWHVEKLHITNQDSSIMVRGLWKSRSATPRVQAALTLEANDIGGFLTRLGHADRVTRGSGKLEGILSWQGSPQSIDYSTLDGTFKLNARRGQFPKFEPGIGRLFGIFNLRSLPRRITLDFRDVFSEGFGFDDISGSVKINDGVAFTDEIRIEGPAARVVMNGQMNLEAETQKLHIKVTPSYGLASPVVGMASVIASTALKNPTTSKEYDITGTWANPVVTRISREAQESIEPEQSYFQTTGE